MNNKKAPMQNRPFLFCVTEMFKKVSTKNIKSFKLFAEKKIFLMVGQHRELLWNIIVLEIVE